MLICLCVCVCSSELWVEKIKMFLYSKRNTENYKLMVHNLIHFKNISRFSLHLCTSIEILNVDAVKRSP